MTQAILARIEHTLNDYGPEPIAAEIAALQTQLAEARAEVERLRPAAEAWESLEAWIQACSGPPLPPPEEVRAAYRAHVAAADRARAAKESQP